MAATVATPTPTPTLREEIIDKIAALLTVALGLVAALAWNGAVQATFARYFGTAGALGALYTYAIIVTVVAVLATIWIGRSATRAHQIARTGSTRQRPIA